MINPNAAVCLVIPLALLAVIFAPGVAQIVRRRRRMASKFAAPGQHGATSPKRGPEFPQRAGACPPAHWSSGVPSSAGDAVPVRPPTLPRSAFSSVDPHRLEDPTTRLVGAGGPGPERVTHLTSRTGYRGGSPKLSSWGSSFGGCGKTALRLVATGVCLLSLAAALLGAMACQKVAPTDQPPTTHENVCGEPGVCEGS